MALKKYNPVTPGQRQLVLVDRSGALFRRKPVKALTEGKQLERRPQQHGRITMRFRGGGHKQAYRRIDFKRRKFDMPAKVERLEYDPNRTAFIALIKYETASSAYILAPQRLAVGDTVVAGEHVDVKPGNAMPVANIPVGTIVHNIEIKIGKGGQIARSAGTYAQLVGRDGDYVIVRLNSGEQRLVHGRCIATVGAVSNPDNMNISIGKAGRTAGWAASGHVRGETMNPVDHPLGGGEPRGGRHPVTPWGKPTKGKKTRKNKRTAEFIMVSRHARKKKGESGASWFVRSGKARLSTAICSKRRMPRVRPAATK
jgi:large subunit ribosomal protein L2